MPRNTPVSTIMTKEVVFANQFHPFSQVVRLFSEFGVHHLPVVDGKNALIGIISSNDILKLFKQDKFKGQALDLDSLDAAINIKDIMTENPRTVTPTDTVYDAAEIFRLRQFQALPVVDPATNELCGIVSVKDIVDFYVEKVEELS